MTSIYQKQTRPRTPFAQVVVRSVVKFGNSFCLQTSLHGFNQIAVPGRHWMERLLWICVTGIAVWGLVDTSLGHWQRYNENPTVVTLDKDFQTWRFDLPAVTACCQNRVNKEALQKVIKTYWDIEPSDLKYDYYSRFVDVVANSNLFELKRYQEFKDDATLDVDLFKLVKEVMVSQPVKMFSSEPVTPKWIPVMTESGVCHTINSLATTDVAIVKPLKNDTAQFPYTCKYSGQSCYVTFEINDLVDFYVHSPYDIADTLTSPFSTSPLLSRFVSLSSMETKAGKGVRDLAANRRRCHYTDEPITAGRQIYSTHSCQHECRSQLAIKLCGCKPFYYFYEGFTKEEPMCSPAGMACLSAYAQRLETLTGVKCVCSQQCLDSVYSELSRSDQKLDNSQFKFRAGVRFTVQAPRTRYTREIMFHFYDLVVSFGGATGLFLGASFISFVEIIYFFLNYIFQIDASEDILPANAKRRRPYELRIQELTNILEG